MIEKPITYFPYTHGDTVDAARLQIREEMQKDLRNRIAMIETKEKAKFGPETYERLNAQSQLNFSQKHP